MTRFSALTIKPDHYTGPCLRTWGTRPPAHHGFGEVCPPM